MKSKQRIWTIVLVLAVMLTGILLLPLMAPHPANAAAQETAAEQATENSGETVQPRIWTNLSLNLKGENGVVTASVKNTFTLFPSTVPVSIELYFSETYTTDYTKMDVVVYDSTPDLNMGETISVSAPTQGVQGYWCARVRYQENMGSFKDMITPVCLYDEDANFIAQY